MQYLKKFSGEILRLVIFAAVLGGVTASGQVYKWSQTAGTNANVDPHINWSEGQAPSSINDSARAMMAELAKYRDDLSGSVVTGGTATAYTLTTNQGLGTGTPIEGQMIAFVPNLTNGIAPTLATDGGSAFPIQSSFGVAVAAGTLISGTPYRATFRGGAAWILQDFYGTPFSIPLGGLMPYTGTTAPNSNFILPAGQCLSTTTYAAYWAFLGSPASGTCSGGQFAVIDLRGRTLAALDNLNGSAASRLTSATTGCGTAMTSVGAVCANGVEGFTLTLAQLPTGITAAGTFALSQSNIVNSNASVQLFSANAGAQVWAAFPSTATVGVGNPSASGTVTSNNTSGAAHPNIPPIIGVTYLLRVI